MDIQPAQSYFYEHDIFPLALSEVRLAIDGNGFQLANEQENDGSFCKKVGNQRL